MFHGEDQQTIPTGHLRIGNAALWANGEQKLVEVERRKVLPELLRSLDGADYGFWNFDVCTLQTGPFKGTCAVSIGSNKKNESERGILHLR